MINNMKLFAQIRNIKQSLLIGFTFFVFSGCSNYLDVQPMGRAIPDTAEEFDALLQVMLNDIDYGNSSFIFGNSDLFDYECYADNIDLNVKALDMNGVEIPSSISPVYIGTTLPGKGSLYIKLYEVIRNCNIIIENLENDGSIYTKNVLGTAYAIRGIAYYQLVKDFCEPIDKNNITNQLGVPLVYSFDMEERPIRSSMSETISRIESDLRKAITFQVTDEIYRFNESVIRAYLARLYFWSENWDAAILESKWLLDKYPLLSGTSYANMLQSELSATGNILIKSCIYRTASEDLILSTLKGKIKTKPLSKEFVELFTEKGDDIRYSLVMTGRRESIKKFLPCIRTDEMCLIIAEAYAHKEDSDNALLYLNKLRDNRIDGSIPYTLSTLPGVNSLNLIKEDATGMPLTPLIQAILNERRKELYLEGDRWYELKRNGRPEFWRLYSESTQKVVTEKFMYTFPLPVSDIMIVDGLIQNPGYTF